MEKSSKIKIGFSFTDRLGQDYSASSHVEIYDILGETELGVIGEKLNIFLKQIGYARVNEYILMEDITGKEYEALYTYLQEFRLRGEKG